MECNKDEAVRAKEIAETKMQNKDFAGARKIALKAQQLYPDLDNISQMIMVCDVHCAAENKVYGNEKDWYGILKIESTADEASIKKQYRKFALLLHPDKNKFAGAADAFKLIGEAQRVLLDHEKRMLHDTKCRASARPTAPSWATQQANRSSNVGKQPWIRKSFIGTANSRFTGINVQHQQSQQQPSSGFNNQQTFWTVCPFCAVRYQYYREVINKILCCQSCKKSFTGYEINTQGSSGTVRNQHAPEQKEMPSQNTSENPTSKMGFPRNIGDQNPTRESFPKPGCTSNAKRSKTNEKYGNADVKNSNEVEDKDIKSSGKINGKKMKQVAESSESFNTGSSTESEEDINTENDGDSLAGKSIGSLGEQHRRRSTRLKRHVSYDENLSDEDNGGTSAKKAKCGGSFDATGPKAEVPVFSEDEPEMKKTASLAKDVGMSEDEMKQCGTASKDGRMQNGEEIGQANKKATASDNDPKKSCESNGVSPSISSSKRETNAEFLEYPDPDFSDFEKSREVECFSVGQIWAVYDNLDGMPRFYARIRKVFSPGFKLRITWLEPEPDDEDEIKWVDEGLPVSCGRFRSGNSENTGDHPMFSHLVDWEKGNRRDTYKIYPRKGETWALFQNWDIKWYSDVVVDERKYKYEFVEVLSDYVEGVGVSVAYMDKLKGFASLFCRTARKGVDSFQLSPNELFRFSHRVPSFQMTGNERGDVPQGSFELDPASLPTNLEEIEVPEDLKVEAGNMNSNGTCSECPADTSESMIGSKGKTSQWDADRQANLDPNQSVSDNFPKDSADMASPSTPEAYEIPDPVFYNFDADKSPQRFQTGHIWALYSDEDGLPKYYAQIKKIDSQPEFKLYVTWLDACSLPKDLIKWIDKEMPITCGRFKLKKGKPVTYTSTLSFSHRLNADPTDEKNVFAIFPRKGEVWALYKNWNAGITRSELESCDYEMVEILEENNLWMEVLVLELVDGFKSVFKAQMKEGSSVTMKIPRAELLRVSHQIPAFRLTEERGGVLRGFWELDPAALPVFLFCSS